MATMISSTQCNCLPSAPPASLNGAALKSFECSRVNFIPRSLPWIAMQQRQSKLYGLGRYKSRVSVHAEYNGSSRRESRGGDFLGGFLLGGIVFGALGYLFAPQISKSLYGGDENGLRKKLPKIVDEDDQGLEATRMTLNEKIAQLNSAIDDVSAQLRAEDHASGSIAGVTGVESAV